MSVKTQQPYGVVNFICQLGGWFWTTLTFTSVDFEEADWTPCVGGPHPIRWRLETRTKRLASPCKRAFSSSLPWTLSAPLALLGIHPLAFGLDLHSQLSCLSSLLAHTTDFGHINFHSYMKQFLIKKKKNPLPPASHLFLSIYGIPCFFTLHSIVLCRYCGLCLFDKLEANVWHPCVKQVYRHLFFQWKLFTSCLCHKLVILAIFSTLSLLYFLWWPVISDLWCNYCNCFGAPRTVSI